MTNNELLNIVKKGENIRTEFKIGKEKLPLSLFETVCPFLNTVGGTILLGVDDHGKILGVENSAVIKLKKDIANLANNPQKLSPSIMLKIEDFEIKGKKIISITVPESSQVHNSNNKIFVRNEDGDYKVSHPVEIAKIVNRKQNYYSEQRVFPHVTFDDFNPDLIKRAKNLIHLNSSGHHWAELDDKNFLKRAGFYKTNDENKEGYTLAAVLFFGTGELIQSIVPAYKFEALLRKHNVDRYDDRLTVRTNLIDTYDILMGFIEKHLNDPFFLEGTTRISLRDKIFRELVANIIAHREYMSSSPAFINVFANKVEFSNPNNPRVFGKIDPKNFTPFAKNPTISKLMLQMGRVEEVGSGIRNIDKYLPHYSKGATYEFVDKEFFSTIVYLDEKLEENEKIIAEKNVLKSADKIIEIIKENPKISAEAISEKIKISSRAVEKHLSSLTKQGVIKRKGSKKSGNWIIIN